MLTRRQLTTGFLAAPLMLSAYPVAAREMPYAVRIGQHIGQLGLSPARLQNFAGHLADTIQATAAPGFVVKIARHGQTAMQAAIGWRDIEAREPMTMETRFRIASMTKPVTATVILRLIEDGRLQLQDPVARFLPAFAQSMVWDGPAADAANLRPARRAITILDLLSNRSGMGYGGDTATMLGKRWAEFQPEPDETSIQFATRLAGAPLYFDPGSDFLYSYSYDVLGAVIEAIEGESLNQVFHRLVFAPLQMHSTGFSQPIAGIPQAQLYRRDDTGALIAVGRPAQTSRSKYFSGGAGLWSTAPDFMRFAQMPAFGGKLGHVRILSPISVAMLSNSRQQSGDLERRFGPTYAGVGYGLGVSVVEDPAKTPYLSNKGDFAWGGSYDTQWIVSPQTGLVATLFNQVDPVKRAFPKRTYEDFRNLLFACITD